MRWIGPLALFMVSAIAAHWATLAYAPNVIMDRTLSVLKDRDIALHDFTTPVRISPQTQAVVRSSPDLFYSLCRYDLSAPGSVLKVTMSEWPGYQSLSFFDAATNNFHTQRGSGKRVEVTLGGPDAAGGIASPTRKGVVLIRRLAPTLELFDEAKLAGETDACELVTS